MPSKAKAKHLRRVAAKKKAKNRNGKPRRNPLGSLMPSLGAAMISNLLVPPMFADLLVSEKRGGND